MTSLSRCRVTRNAVIIGDVVLPDYIAEDGVTVQPGGGKNINRVTVTFLVGEVICEDPHEPLSG